MGKFIQGVWPPIKLRSKEDYCEKHDLSFVVPSPETIEHARRFGEALKELATMEDWEAEAHIGHDVNHGYKHFIREKRWEIVKDGEEMLKIYIPPYQSVDPRDLDSLSFQANRQLYVHRERIK
ncbi:hypothetical protein J4408_03005 [Candidatus Pacearchaeota archaeon]|nr:hypothetical protein [Candidatus Pacearchaeota archaeon]